MKLALLKQHPRKLLALLALLAVAYYFCLPHPLFNRPSCMVLEDRDGQLLGAKIASDGQWRFPAIDSIPQKFEIALLQFEDQRFYRHIGVDFWSLGRALGQNIRNGRVVSGGSTLSMQVIRLSRPGKARSIWQKAIEIMLATRLELRHTKSEILNLYATHAPFGGNVVGLETASWRYFGKSPQLLSWAEAAMLAVLPNSPGLIHPGRNRAALRDKRNRLLKKLFTKGIIDQFTLDLATEEPLPDAPLPLPQLAPHLLERAHKEVASKTPEQPTRVRTSLQAALQQQLNAIVSRHQNQLKYNEIYNAAALLLDIETGEVLAYCGNAPTAGAAHQGAVDIVKAPRSTGSILKPILYAFALQDGLIVPTTLLPDVPTQLGGYRPENFHEEYDGIISAKRALIRSLNVPMVNLLQQYGLEKFHFQLNELGFTTIQQPASYYGLPLILGGAEANLWELTSIYASMARTLIHHDTYDSQYVLNDFRAATYLPPANAKPSIIQAEAPKLSADAIWFTFEAMQALERPSSEGVWQAFDSNQKIAWKTGTSFGFRDAWAIGVNTKYAVGVWVGNADGEGRPGLVGVQAAAPILFDIFEYLPTINTWFEPPFDAMHQRVVCRQSGQTPQASCELDTIWAPKNNNQLQLCPYHQVLHLDATTSWRVNSQCYPPDQMIHQPWFVLPPMEAFYHSPKNPAYKVVPPQHPDCQYEEDLPPMQLVYPRKSTKIYVPVDLDGKLSKTVFSVAHRASETLIHWYIDENYLGNTQFFHNKELSPPAGKHKLTLVDELGNRLERWFEIIEKE